MDEPKSSLLCFFLTLAHTEGHMNFSGHLFQIGKATGLDLNEELELLKKANSLDGGKAYDPELLYVECQLCGKPVIWEEGKTTELLELAGIDPNVLDDSCMIIADGCPLCQADDGEGFTLAVVRLAGLTPDEVLHLMKSGGSA